jgi:Zn finger protein HypA/HybF involved in hydrogenase expression
MGWVGMKSANLLNLAKIFDGIIIKEVKTMENIENGEVAGISLRTQTGYLAWIKIHKSENLTVEQLKDKLSKGKEILRGVFAGESLQMEYDKSNCNCAENPEMSCVKKEVISARTQKPYTVYSCPKCGSGYLKQRDGSFKKMEKKG